MELESPEDMAMLFPKHKSVGQSDPIDQCKKSKPHWEVIGIRLRISQTHIVFRRIQVIDNSLVRDRDLADWISAQQRIHALILP